jgi:hypothetical protein
MQQSSQEKQLKAFRRAVSKYPEWPEGHKQLAESIALYIELGAATYEGNVVTSYTEKILQLVAEGKLCLPDNSVIYLSQLPSTEATLAVMAEGLCAVIERDGEFVAVTGGPQEFPKPPSVEELLGGV